MAAIQAELKRKYSELRGYFFLYKTGIKIESNEIKKVRNVVICLLESLPNEGRKWKREWICVFLYFLFTTLHFTCVFCLDPPNDDPILNNCKNNAGCLTCVDKYFKHWRMSAELPLYKRVWTRYSKEQSFRQQTFWRFIAENHEGAEKHNGTWKFWCILKTSEDNGSILRSAAMPSSSSNKRRSCITHRCFMSY